jgi:hypothetical protein
MKTTSLITRAINNWVIPRVRNHLPLWCIPQKNTRFKAYCVGAHKTGTTSIHKAFSQNYRSAHEPEARVLTDQLLAFATGKIDKDEFTQFVKRREKGLGLEMNSSGHNYLLIDILVKEWSEAKFILTIRDCYSWLDSILNHQYRNRRYNQARYAKNPFRKMRDLRQFFRYHEFKHAPEEKILADNGFYTLDNYFQRWQEHIHRVITTVPKDRLLIVKTTEINQDIPKIEKFLELTPGSLLTQVRENVGRDRQKHYFLTKIDQDFLEAKANSHCKELMDKYFPEVKGFNLHDLKK